jgi:hypothetical protein
LAAGLAAAFLAVLPARDVAAFAADAVRLAAGFPAVFFAAAPDALVVRVVVAFAPALDFDAAALVVRFVAPAAFCAPLPAAVRPPAGLDADAAEVFLVVVVFFAAVLRELAVFLAAGLRAVLDFVLRVAFGCGTRASPPVGAGPRKRTRRPGSRREKAPPRLLASRAARGQTASGGPKVRMEWASQPRFRRRGG